MAIYRVPEGLSIITPRSYCPKCHKTLKNRMLMPIVSYLMLKGKCGFCQSRVSLRYPTVELANGLFYVLVFMRYGVSFETLALCFLTSLMLTMALIDFDTMLIPNRLVLIGLLGGAIVTLRHFTKGYGVYYTSGQFNGIIGLFACSGALLLLMLVTMLFYKDGGIGMGDVKILMPIGLFLGWQLTFLGLWLASIIGAIVGILMLKMNKMTRKDAIPFGPAIAIGMYISMIYGGEIIGFLY